MDRNYYYACGGGCGDCTHSFMHDPICWLIGDLVKNHGVQLRVITCCHNDGVNDLFRFHPYIHEHISESWETPTVENQARFSNPIDGYSPLHWAPSTLGVTPVREQPFFALTDEEKIHLDELASGPGPLIVAQPFAGLSDRDAFDPPALERLVHDLVQLQPNVRIVVVGKNHDRGHHYSHECVGFEHPNVIDCIDKTGIRWNWHLTSRCDAFVGAHSNLIRVAWDFRRRNAIILPQPSMTDHLPKLDPKYTYGLRSAESQIFTYNFGPEKGVARDFTVLDMLGIAKHLLGR